MLKNYVYELVSIIKYLFLSKLKTIWLYSKATSFAISGFLLHRCW